MVQIQLVYVKVLIKAVRVVEALHDISQKVENKKIAQVGAISAAMMKKLVNTFLKQWIK